MAKSLFPPQTKPSEQRKWCSDVAAPGIKSYMPCHRYIQLRQSPIVHVSRYDQSLGPSKNVWRLWWEHTLVFVGMMGEGISSVKVWCLFKHTLFAFFWHEQISGKWKRWDGKAMMMWCFWDVLFKRLNLTNIKHRARPLDSHIQRLLNPTLVTFSHIPWAMAHDILPLQKFPTRQWCGGGFGGRPRWIISCKAHQRAVDVKVLCHLLAFGDKNLITTKHPATI